MTVTTTDPRRVIPDAVAGAAVVDLVETAAPAALVAFEAVKQFVHSGHGRAITAYWQAFDGVSCRPDWVIEATMDFADDVDLLIGGIVDLVNELSTHYVESGTATEPTRERLAVLLQQLRT